ncbi:MAG: glycosyltransferase family 87 protein [Bacteroidota bacterium]
MLYEARGEGDFKIFIDASRDLIARKNIYRETYNQWFHYYYDVLFAVLLVPFTFIPLYFAKLIWLFANVYFTFRIFKIVWSWLPLEILTPITKKVFKILSFVFVLAFLRDNFHVSQLTIFILFLTLQGLDFIRTGHKIKGSSLLALGINIKILPIVFIPYLIYRNEIRPAFYVLVFMGIFLMLPVVFIGNSYNQFLLQERWHIINPVNAEHVMDTGERSFHSLTTLLSTLLVKNCGDKFALPLKRNVADVSMEVLSKVINVVRLILVFAVLYFLKSKPFQIAPTNLQRLYEVSYLCLLIPLIFPHQQHYAFLFIFPATTYLLFFISYLYFQNESYQKVENFCLRKNSLFIVMLMIYLLTNSHFILGTFNKWCDHYKTLTYGALILLVVLACCNPKKFIKEIELSK